MRVTRYEARAQSFISVRQSRVEVHFVIRSTLIVAEWVTGIDMTLSLNLICSIISIAGKSVHVYNCASDNLCVHFRLRTERPFFYPAGKAVTCVCVDHCNDDCRSRLLRQECTVCPVGPECGNRGLQQLVSLIVINTIIGL